jgi:hypothetical protein
MKETITSLSPLPLLVAKLKQIRGRFLGLSSEPPQRRVARAAAVGPKARCEGRPG